MSRSIKSLIIPIAIIVMFAVFVVNQWRLTISDSLTIDEKAHLAASVSYVNDRSLALNPEHPPLVKMLIGISVNTFLNPVLPSLSQTTQLGVNRQYEHGDSLLTLNTSQHDQMIQFGRLPIVILSSLFALIFYLYSRSKIGSSSALIAFVLFVSSPTIIAHSHLMTFDLAAALGFFLAIVSFSLFLTNGSFKSVVFAGMALGFALSVKFSALLLIPIFILVAIIWLLIKRPLNVYEFFKNNLLIYFMAFSLIYLLYFFLSTGYEPIKNQADVLAITKDYPRQSIMQFTATLAGNRLTQPIGEFALGAIQTLSRSQGGNATMFLGKVENYGHPLYFPILFLVKESLSTILIVLATGFWGIGNLISNLRTNRWQQLTLKYPTEFLILLTVLVYWILAVTSTLNIGFRHVLPTIPLIYYLVAFTLHKNWPKKRSLDISLKILIFILLIWTWIVPLKSYPNLLNYYNELVGGSNNGNYIAVDSNYDWGQDLRRLKDYVVTNQIENIAIDYFGGDSVDYYFGQDFRPWYSSKGPVKGWLAISATTLENSRRPHGPDLPIDQQDTYSWLNNHQPVAKIGSIFLYYLP